MGPGTGVSMATVSYDTFFQENYDTLHRWAMHITGYDRELSEDLVHDVYVRFSQRTDVGGMVDSVHGYLYQTLKNAHLSHLRRRKRIDQSSLSDYEHLDHRSLTFDPRKAHKTDDELLAICHYACARKSESISSSILILRFFHGYFSAEVARIVSRSRNAVEARLHKARQEIALYLLQNSEISRSEKKRRLRFASLNANGDLLRDLREIIYSAASGTCIRPDWLRGFYRKNVGGLGREELGHIVSCAKCLDNVNALLRMPMLRSRHPLESLGPQSISEVLERNQSRTGISHLP